MKKKNPIEDYKLLEKIAFKYTEYTINNKDGITSDSNYSLIQYNNQTVLKNHFKGALEIIHELDKSKSYLNVGMGAGFIEAWAEAEGGWSIDSVEWEKQEPYFRVLREEFGVNNYLIDIVTDVNSEDFKINTNKKYDYVILSRFYPINKKWAKTQERFNELIDKFRLYADQVIIFDSISNFLPEWLLEWEIKQVGTRKNFVIITSNFISQN